jgi:hypothetical protein
MIGNRFKLKLNAGSLKIDPAFKGKDYVVVKWETALQKYQAKATWPDQENAESYGILTIDNEGRASFVPTKEGQFTLKCMVRYRDDVTNEWAQIENSVTITVLKSDESNCICEVKISAKEQNIISKETDGLYVPNQDKNIVKRIAGETISALLAVYELDNKIFKLDFRDGEHITLLTGLTNSAADIGGAIDVHVSGIIEDASFNWTLGRVYIGVDGRLTQTPPATGYLLCIGSAVSKTRINLNFQDPIKLG